MQHGACLLMVIVRGGQRRHASDRVLSAVCTSTEPLEPKALLRTGCYTRVGIAFDLGRRT